MKKGKPLNSKTPQWFKDWHGNHYSPLQAMVGRNTKLIYIILATILGAALVGNGNLDLISKIVGVFFG